MRVVRCSGRPRTFRCTSAAWRMRWRTSSKRFEWQADDLVLLNDPFLGGTHLPDVTAVCPVFCDDELIGFAACRAHHANIGSDRPGSMPVSTSLEEEGIVIAPMLAQRDGVLTTRRRVRCSTDSRDVAHDSPDDVSQRRTSRRFFCADERVPARCEARCRRSLDRWARPDSLPLCIALNDYAERIAREAIAAIPDGEYAFEDRMDDDGVGTLDVPIRVRIRGRGRSRRRRIFPGRRSRCAATSTVRCRSPRPPCCTCFDV